MRWSCGKSDMIGWQVSFSLTQHGDQCQFGPRLWAQSADGDTLAADDLARAFEESPHRPADVSCIVSRIDRSSSLGARKRSIAAASTRPVASCGGGSGGCEGSRDSGSTCCQTSSTSACVCGGTCTGGTAGCACGTSRTTCVGGCSSKQDEANEDHDATADESGNRAPEEGFEDLGGVQVGRPPQLEVAGEEERKEADRYVLNASCLLEVRETQ